jgi:hypothetical protein
LLVKLRDGKNVSERFGDNSNTVHVLVEKFVLVPVHTVPDLSSDGSRDTLDSGEFSFIDQKYSWFSYLPQFRRYNVHVKAARVFLIVYLID